MDYRLQHTAMAMQAVELAQDLREVTEKYENLKKQAFFSDMTVALQTDTDGIPLSNGEVMTPERFIFRTEQWKNSIQTIRKLTNEIHQLKDTITNMKLEKETLLMQSAGQERMLRRFEQPRPFTVFGDEMKQEVIAENHRLVDEVERLEEENSGLKDEVLVLRERVARKKNDKRRREDVVVVVADEEEIVNK